MGYFEIGRELLIKSAEMLKNSVNIENIKIYLEMYNLYLSKNYSTGTMGEEIWHRPDNEVIDTLNIVAKSLNALKKNGIRDNNVNDNYRETLFRTCYRLDYKDSECRIGLLADYYNNMYFADLNDDLVNSKSLFAILRYKGEEESLCAKVKNFKCNSL